MNKRPNWNNYWMKIAKDISERSTCLRHHFGCVIVKDNIIISTGYNGAPRGFRDCTEIGCTKDKLNISSGTGHEKCIGIHCEQNALLQAGKESKGAILYVNGYPCKICARLMINSGIKEVVITGSYSDIEGLKLLKKAKIKVTFI